MVNGLSAKAYSPIWRNVEGSVTDVSAVFWEKELAPMLTTPSGMVMDGAMMLQNAMSPMCRTVLGRFTCVSPDHAKHQSGMVSMPVGMSIDDRLLQ